MKENFAHLIGQWLIKVRAEVESAKGHSDVFLIDHLQSFMDIACLSLQFPNDQYLILQCKENAKLHGKQRSTAANYSVEAIALEYSILRELLLETVSPDVSSITGSAGALARIFDTAISTSTAEYLKHLKDIPSAKEEAALIDFEGLRIFFENAPTPLALMLGEEHRFVLANNAYCELTGKQPVSKSVREVFSEEEAGGFFGLLDQVFRTGVPFLGTELPFKTSNPKLDHKLLFINIAYHPYRDHLGQIIGVLALVYDVTDLVRSKKAAESSEIRLQEIFSHAAVGFAVSTLEGEIIEANPRFTDITGYPKIYLIGSHVQDLVHPGDRAREAEQLKKLTSGQVKSFVIEKRFIRKDAKVVWVRNSVSIVHDSEGESLIIRVAEDITAAKEEMQLRLESEERFLTLADSMPQIVWTATDAGDLDYFNQVWFDYSGSNHKESSGSGWAKYVHPDDLARTAENWRKSLETSSPYENEFRLKSKDGSYRWYVARAVPSLGAESKVKKWYGTNTDVDDFKQLASKLEQAQAFAESEKRKFESIFADAGTSMALLRGPDFIYEIANPSYLSLFQNRKIMGLPLIEALPELKDQPFIDLARSVLETGVAYRDHEALAFLKRSDDAPIEERYFDQSYSRILDEAGKPYGVFMHAIEVTEKVKTLRELKVTSERFKNAVDAAEMGTWEVSPISQVVSWSERTNELFGVDKTDEIPLETALARIHPEDKDRVSNAIKAAMDPSGTGDYKIEYRVIKKDGATSWLSLLGKSFFTETKNGRVTSLFAGTVLDVTERVLAEVELRDAKERAEAANAAKSSFLANMSHEIRTPLGAIMGFVSLIKDEHTTPQMLTEYVSVIERNSTQLMRIIDDILDLSKVEAGMMLIEHIDFSLIELLSDFSSLMGFRAREKGIVFELKVQSELPAMINSDPTRIRQILTNVVGNAIKFTEAGSVVLRVTYFENVVSFEVEDTGRGLTEQQISRLFQPFSQADVSTTRKFGGTGLGLVLTRKLSEALGGGFHLTSTTPDVGSIFTATVEVQVKENTLMVKALGYATQGIKDAGIPTQLRNIKVLLVEDSLDNQALFSIFLSRAGAEIDIASDGAQGVEMALAEKYDVILMDVQMPVMDGISAVRKLRASNYAGPIIALTAHAMKEERIRCIQAGYTSFLSKPVQRNDLVDELMKYTKRRLTDKL